MPAANSAGPAVDDLAGGFEPLRDRRIGREHSAYVLGDALADTKRHAARPKDAAGTIHCQRWETSLGDGGHVRCARHALLLVTAMTRTLPA